jgi:hypothetical protein
MSEVRPTIGVIKCPIGGDLAEVRQDKKGKLYYVGVAGMIKPNTDQGQAWLIDNFKKLDQETAEKLNAEPPKFGRRSVGAFLQSLEFQKPVEQARPGQSEKKAEVKSGGWFL